MLRLLLDLTPPPISRGLSRSAAKSAFQISCFNPGNGEPNVKSIFVGNLGFDATEGAIRELFEAHGTVGRINLVRDRDTGTPRGFAFVEMANNAEADRAIAELNGVNLGGKALNVNEARPKTEHSSGERGFGGKRW
jgi:cold-inducible RNA-binding protein